MRLVPSKSTRTDLIAVLVLVGALAACGSGSNSTAASNGDQSQVSSAASEPEDGIGVVAPGTPCPKAVHGDPLKLAAVSEAPVYLPRDGAEQVTGAWRCGDTPVLMFGNVQLSFESGWGNVQVPEKFDDLARDYGGSVETIQGLPAWVAPSSAAASNSEVLMVKDGAAIRLLARRGVPIGDLVALASILDLEAPISG